MSSWPLDEQLRNVFIKAKLPSSPTLAVRILELANDPDSTVDQFASLIQTDPVLVARLLQMSNSVAFGQQHEVISIERAVNILGISRVRVLSLGFQLMGQLNQFNNCMFNMERFWQHSLLRACLARELAIMSCPSCVDDAFLIGLLQDSGMILLLQLFGQSYADLCEDASLLPSEFFAVENQQNNYDHAQASAFLAREWKLPAIIISLLEHHHEEPDTVLSPNDTDRLRSISFLVGAITLSTNECSDVVKPELCRFAEQHLNINVNEAKQVVIRTGESYKAITAVLQGSIPEDLDVTDLLNQANAQLASSIESQHRESSKNIKKLESSLGDYRDRAARDPLTQLFNRGAVVDHLDCMIHEAVEEDQTVCVMFLDVDNFKFINDNYGHATGDIVLQGVAATLQRCVPHEIVGRFGGEEFLIIVRNLSKTQAFELAETVVDSIRQTQFHEITNRISITCSLGIIWGEVTKYTLPKIIVQRADELMYEAKRAGKNRLCFREITSDYNVSDSEPATAAAAACEAVLEELSSSIINAGAVLSEDYIRIIKQMKQEASDDGLRQRKMERKLVCAPCTITSFSDTTLEINSCKGFVRNVSNGGVGVLSTQLLRRGQPVEVSLLSESGNVKLYVAGVVAYCRHAEGIIQEVGVKLYTHARHPILSIDPIQAFKDLDWAVAAMHSCQHQPKHVC